MKSEEALKIVDDLANVVIVTIPDEIVIDGRKYEIKDDMRGGDREEMLRKYEQLYEELREKIKGMEDVPEEMVKKALILRRTVLFLKDFRGSEDIEDKKRWMDYIKRVSE